MNFYYHEPLLPLLENFELFNIFYKKKQNKEFESSDDICFLGKKKKNKFMKFSLGATIVAFRSKMECQG